MEPQLRQALGVPPRVVVIAADDVAERLVHGDLDVATVWVVVDQVHGCLGGVDPVRQPRQPDHRQAQLHGLAELAVVAAVNAAGRVGIPEQTVIGVQSVFVDGAASAHDRQAGPKLLWVAHTSAGVDQRQPLTVVPEGLELGSSDDATTSIGEALHVVHGPDSDVHLIQ